jgi:AcrR family transcriptional regulator
MPAAIIAKDDVLTRIFGVFKAYGYEGATLARISESTGLGRASLYHYFPGGKDEMAREVLHLAQGWLKQNVVEPLSGSGSIQARLKTMTQNVRAGYSDGSDSCVMNLLGVGEADAKFHPDLRETIELWLHALEGIFRESGMPAGRSRRLAVDTVARTQGALVVARALGDTAVFTRTLSELERELIEETQRA